MKKQEGHQKDKGCVLDYEYIKNHYKLISVGLSRQKELDADPNAIKQVEFVGKLRNNDGENAGGT